MGRKRKQVRVAEDRERAELRVSLRRLGVRPQKKFGQVFLFRRVILEDMVQLGQVKPEDTVIEIGAGIGTLTVPLAERAHRVVALEYDRRMAGLLGEEIPLPPNVDVRCEDALHFDTLRAFRESGRKLKVMGNIPYYLSSPLVYKFVKERSCLDLMVVMLQKEVADRIVAQPGSRLYGTISVFSQLFASVWLAIVVARDCFYPVPEVDSAVVVFRFRAEMPITIVDEDFFEKVVRSAFAQRRKTLLNSLVATGPFGGNREKVSRAILDAGIVPNRRAETLSLHEFEMLSNALRAM